MKHYLLLLLFFVFIAKLTSAQVDIAELKEKLIYYYPLDGDGVDASPMEQEELELSATLTFDEGKFGQGAVFDGSGTTYFVSPGGLFMYGDPEFNYTFTFWIRNDGDLAIREDIMQPLKGSGSGQTILYRHADGSYRTSMHQPTSSGDVKAQNDWDHIALTCNQSDMVVQIYVNGEIAGDSNPGALKGPNDGGIVHGMFDVNASRPFTGMMDEVCLFNTVLTQEEIFATMEFADLLDVSTDTKELINANIYVYANEMNIELKEASVTQIEIFNISGKKVFADQLNDNRYKKKLQLDKGVYITRLTNQHGTIHKKVSVR